MVMVVVCGCCCFLLRSALLAIKTAAKLGAAESAEFPRESRDPEASVMAGH